MAIRRDTPDTGPTDSGTCEHEGLPSFVRPDPFADEPLVPDEVDTSLASSPDAVVRFLERDDQVMICDFRIFVFGVEVTNWTSSLIIGQHSREGVNSASFQLANPFNIFTITNANLEGKWRPGGLGHEQYSEFAKRSLFEKKCRHVSNITDVNGIPRWPFNPGGLVFHKMDPVRIFVHMPTIEAITDPNTPHWIPAFTGWIEDKPATTGFITGEANISISCTDLKGLMSRSRVRESALDSVLDANRKEDPILKGGLIKDVARRDATNHPFANMPLEDIISHMIVGVSYLSPEGTESPGGFDVLTAGFGRMKIGKTARYPPVHDTPENRRRMLEAWHRLSVFGVWEFPGKTAHSKEEEEVRTLLDDIDSERLGYIKGEISESEAKKVITAKIQKIVSDLKVVRPDLQPAQIEEVIGVGGPLRRRPGVAESVGVPVLAREILTSSSGAEVLKSTVMDDFRSAVLAVASERPISPDETHPSTTGSTIVQRRPLTDKEVDIIGAGTTIDGDFAPDKRFLNQLLPRKGTGASNLIEFQSEQGAPNEYSWSNRLSMLVEQCAKLDWQLWINGCGDAMAEFPMYSQKPHDFGEFVTVFTYDKHLTDDVSFNDEQGNVDAAVVVTGGTGVAAIPLDTPIARALGFGVVYSPSLASRVGLNVRRVSYPFVNASNQDALNALAALEFQKQIGAATTLGGTFPWRPWITPNRPIYLKGVERIGLIGSVSHSMNLFGECSTSFETLYVRQRDRKGNFRYIFGGMEMPVDYTRMFSGTPTFGTNNVLIPTVTTDKDKTIDPKCKAVPVPPFPVGWPGSISQDFIAHGSVAIDFGASVGTPFPCLATGTVTNVTNFVTSGLTILMVTTDGRMMFYGHFSASLVSIGDFVHVGENIALTGNSGTESHGAHCHVERFTNTDWPRVRGKGKFEDPIGMFTTCTPTGESRSGGVSRTSGTNLAPGVPAT